MKAMLLCLALLSACATIDPSPINDSRQHVVYVNNSLGHGSGVVINDYCVVTAAHVTDGDQTGVVTNAHGTAFSVAVRAADIDSDVAVVCSENPLGVPPVKFAKAMPAIWSEVYTIGFPLSYRWIYTHGEYQGESTMTAEAAPGNSGGGVFNDKGEYIGLVQTIAVYRSTIGALTFGHLCGIVEVDKVKALLDKEHIHYEI